MLKYLILHFKFLKHLTKVWKVNGFIDSIQIIKHYKYFFEWRKQLASGKTAFELDIPWINIESYYKIIEILKNNDLKHWKVFEYGAGGSTYFFLSNNLDVTSVEHNKSWAEEIFERNKISTNLDLIFCPQDEYYNGDKNKQLLYTSSQPGYIGVTFYKYASVIDNYPNHHFNIVLVDGRARNACLTHAYSKVKYGGYLILDNGDRHRYFPTEIIPKIEFKLIYEKWSPSICDYAWTKTLIYQRIQ